jgi:hypothetical protein
MKKTIIYITALVAFFTFQSCDKVKNPYPKQYVDVDTTLLYGVNLETYKNTLWPTFGPNTNTLANVLIEDFTGHKCINCPDAAIKIHDIAHLNADRVFIAAIHSGPRGSMDFQVTSSPNYTTDFTNPNGTEISFEAPASEEDFSSNPSVAFNRKNIDGYIFQTPFTINTWGSTVNSLLANPLKVNLQAATNYFPETRGVFLHTEVDLIQSFTEDLYQVVYLIEDSLIAPQKVPASWSLPNNEDLNYVHKDIHRGCIDGLAMGRKLVDAMKVDKNGLAIQGDKYYLNYSYKLPSQFNPDNMHLLIYVYRKDTKEILQVIKKKIKP